MKHKRPEIHAGDRFGKLTVLELWDRVPNKGHQWLCKCSCGNYALCITTNLLRGRSRSCGCSLIEAFSRAITRTKAHIDGVNDLVEARLDDL